MEDTLSKIDNMHFLFSKIQEIEMIKLKRSKRIDTRLTEVELDCSFYGYEELISLQIPNLVALYRKVKGIDKGYEGCTDIFKFRAACPNSKNCDRMELIWSLNKRLNLILKHDERLICDDFVFV